MSDSSSSFPLPFRLVKFCVICFNGTKPEILFFLMDNLPLFRLRFGMTRHSWRVVSSEQKETTDDCKLAINNIL